MESQTGPVHSWFGKKVRYNANAMRLARGHARQKNRRHRAGPYCGRGVLNRTSREMQYDGAFSARFAMRRNVACIPWSWNMRVTHSSRPRRQDERLSQLQLLCMRAQTRSCGAVGFVAGYQCVHLEPLIRCRQMPHRSWIEPCEGLNSFDRSHATCSNHWP